MKHKLKMLFRKVFYRGKTRFLYEKFSFLKTNTNMDVDDETFLKKRYKENTGLVLNLDNPQLFSEKLNWLKINYRNPLMTDYTDKFLVRKYLKELGYGKYLVKLYGAYDKFEEIDFNVLPECFFMKTNHTSGYNAIYNANNKNRNEFQTFFNKALKTNYYYVGREWNYKNIKPKIIVEELLNIQEYIDYKFFMFNGECEYYAIIQDIIDETGKQSTDSKFNLYDKNNKTLDVNVNRRTFEDDNFEFSSKISEMKKIASDLATPFPFCRVDFLVSSERIYFGEVTFYPNGGYQLMKPLTYERFYGSLIDLESINPKHLKE